MNPIMVADAKETEGKVPVLGILQRGGKVSTQVIFAATSQTFLPIIREKVVPDSIVYTDSYCSDNALDISELKHSRMNPQQAPCGQTPPHHMASRTFGIRQNAIGVITTEFPNNSSPLSWKEGEWRVHYGSPKQVQKTLHH